MSATMRYPAIPTIGNPSPWEQALATTKQDTGGTLGGVWSAPSTPVPYTAPSTTGGGSTWALPDWAWGGNQLGGGTYDQATGTWRAGAPLAAGSDVFGAKLPVGYNSAADRGGLEYNGKNVETYWSRMLRFARDYTQGGINPQQAMQMALDRIRRDNGGTLAGTGFDEGGAGVRPGPGGTLGTWQDLPGGQLPNGGTSVDYGTGATGQGGGTVADINGGGGLPGGARQNVAGGTYSPTGGGSSSLPNFGQLGNVDPTLALQAIQQDPAVAAHYLRLANGQKGPITSRLGQFRDSLYGRALQTFAALQGVGGNATGFGGIQDFLGALNGGNLQGLLNTTAANASGANFAGQDDASVEKILRAAIALKSLGMGSLGSSLMSGDLDNLLYGLEGQNIQENAQGPASEGGGLGRALGADPYGQALQQYLSLR